MGDGEEIELLVVGWGSTGDVMQDVMCSEELREAEDRVLALHISVAAAH